MGNLFPEVKGNFGFGCMRLPMKGEEVDKAEFSAMVDAFIDAGFNYFDTAHGYIGGKSETALRDCLTSRYPRDKYILTNKLSGSYFKTEEDIRPYFDLQLEACGVDYFDFYLMHAQGRKNYDKYKSCRAYETALELRREGKIRHMGISFHDKAEFLDKILTEYPEIEVVQIQFNYLDYEDENVESRKCYEVCRAHGKPIIVMEPVKGGTLVRLPLMAQEVFRRLGSASPASYAIRFAAGFDGMFMTLSGMGDMAMMRDNLSFMTDFKPLNETEMAAVERVRAIITDQNLIQCTACRYCTEGCPKQIPIPDVFACRNAKRAEDDWNSEFYYDQVTDGRGRASDCIGCGRCETICPQHLPIRELLKEIVTELESDGD